MSPRKGRLIAIGDIHGCKKELLELMGLVSPTKADQLVFLGDYVDRGPDSAGVVKFLLELKKRYPKTVFVRGNHDQMYLDARRGQPNQSVWVQNIYMNRGGGTIRQLGVKVHDDGLELPDYFEDFLVLTQIWYEKGKHIFVHAGLPRGRNGTMHPSVTDDPAAEKELVEQFMWIRHGFIDRLHTLKGKIVVFGHTMIDDYHEVNEVHIDEDKIWVDTGCFHTGVLSAVDLTNNAFISTAKPKDVPKRNPRMTKEEKVEVFKRQLKDRFGFVPKYKFMGADDDESVCAVCGKQDLKKVYWLSPLDEDGNVLEPPFPSGSCCGSKLLGMSQKLFETKQHQTQQKKKEEQLKAENDALINATHYKQLKNIVFQAYHNKEDIDRAKKALVRIMAQTGLTHNKLYDLIKLKWGEEKVKFLKAE